MRIFLDLTKGNNDMDDFFKQIKQLIDMVSSEAVDTRYLELDKISKNEVYDDIVDFINNTILKSKVECGRELLTVDLSVRNYNGYHDIYNTFELNVGLYQKSFATGTIYKSYKFVEVDKESQYSKFIDEIKDMTEEQKNIYMNLFNTNDPLYKTFENINDNIMESLYENKKDMNISNITSFDELKGKIQSYIENEYSSLVNLFRFTNLGNVKNGRIIINLSLFGESRDFDFQLENEKEDEEEFNVI